MVREKAFEKKSSPKAKGEAKAKTNVAKSKVLTVDRPYILSKVGPSAYVANNFSTEEADKAQKRKATKKTAGVDNVQHLLK